MKFLAYLPDRRNYNQIESHRDDQIWFVDKASEAIRLRSRVQNPFNRLMVVLLSPVSQKADGGIYPIKFDVQLFQPFAEEIQELQKVEIYREIYKGVGDYFMGRSIAYISIPLQSKLHLAYRFIEK